MEHPSCYSILTADVRYDKRLKPNEKLLFSEITALSNKRGTAMQAITTLLNYMTLLL